MRKRIIAMSLCLALTSIPALANCTKNMTKNTALSYVAGSMPFSVKNTSAQNVVAPSSGIPSNVLNKEGAKRTFEERKAKERALMYATLSFTNEQKAKAEAIDAKTKANIEPLFRKFQAEARKLRDLKAKKANPISIWLQKQSVKATKKSIEKCINSSKKEFQSILTPEQKAKYKIINDAKRKDFENFKKSHKAVAPKASRKHEKRLSPVPTSSGVRGTRDIVPPALPKGKR